MKNVKITDIKIIGVAIIIFMLTSVLEYTGNTEIKESKNVATKPLIISAKAVDTPVAPIITYTEDNMILTYVFKTNRPKVVFGRNIELLGLANGEDIALITVDNEPYQMRYNVEKEIKNCLIKVADPDYSSLTANIAIQYLQ